MSPTLNDLAAEVGVSRSLVSFYMNHPETTRVAARTRKKIDEAIRKLGYLRNENALVTRTGVSKNIALLFDFSYPFGGHSSSNMVISGILRDAAAYGYSLKIYSTELGEANFDSILSCGISYILCFSFSQEYRQQLGQFCREHKLHLCYLQEFGVNDYPTVNSDNFSGMRQLTEYFIGQGHRRFALLTPAHNVKYSGERGNGVLAALADHGLTLETRFHSACKDPNDHYADLERIFSLPESERPTAFVCSDNGRVLKAAFIAMRHGVEIGKNCALGGFGDTLASGFFFPCSAVCESLEEIGSVALKTVMGKSIAPYKIVENRILLPTRLIHYPGFSSEFKR